MKEFDELYCDRSNPLPIHRSLRDHCLDLQYDLDSRELNRVAFDEFLVSEIKRHGLNNEYQAMYAIEHVLTKFRENML